VLEQLWSLAEAMATGCHCVLTHPDTVQFLKSAGETAQALCAATWDKGSKLTWKICAAGETTQRHSREHEAAKPSVGSSAVDSAAACSEALGAAFKQKEEDLLSEVSEVNSEDLDPEVASTTAAEEDKTTSEWTSVQLPEQAVHCEDDVYGAVGSRRTAVA